MKRNEGTWKIRPLDLVCTYVVDPDPTWIQICTQKDFTDWQNGFKKIYLFFSSKLLPMIINYRYVIDSDPDLNWGKFPDPDTIYLDKRLTP